MVCGGEPEPEVPFCARSFAEAFEKVRRVGTRELERDPNGSFRLVPFVGLKRRHARGFIDLYRSALIYALR